MIKPVGIERMRAIGTERDAGGQDHDGAGRKNRESESAVVETRIEVANLTSSDEPVVGLARYLGKLHFVGGRESNHRGVHEQALEVWTTDDKKQVLLYPVTRGKRLWVPLITVDDGPEPIATITTVFDRPMSLREARAAYRSRRRTRPSARG